MRRRDIGLAVALLLAAALPVAAGGPPRATRDLMSDTWDATDALGRTLPGFEECGAPKRGRRVGIFYFLWLGSHGRGLHDITKILAADPANPPWGPWHAFHFWGEPRLGYYTSDDEFVIRKHAQMLTDAGVDAVFFDVTNAVTYDDVYLKICRVYEEIRRTGRATPEVAFLTNSHSARTVKHLYDNFYAKGLHKDLWFRWKGRPVILAPEEGLSEEIKGFFTIRRSWAWSDPNGWFGDGKDKWPWLDHHPQKPGWHESPDRPEEIPVCVAQHPTSNIGRSFHAGRQPPPGERATGKGLCFAEQWKRALEVDPELVFITGWNEWVAQRFENKGGMQLMGKPLPVGGSFFVDAYSQEYSRDIEPMRGGHGDNYYWQMVDGIRRFKGVRPRPKPSAMKTISRAGGFRQWQTVRPEFLDDIGDTFHRDHEGFGGKRYAETSGRNDLEAMKVARDRGRIYFYARTREDVTRPEGDAWMLLLIDADSDPRTGWEGFDFVANRTLKGTSATVLERNVGGRWSWEAARGVAEIRIEVKGNELHLAVPRAALGLGAPRPLRFGFKWADNATGSGDVLDFIDKGDVAPNGRFKYRFEE